MPTETLFRETFVTVCFSDKEKQFLKAVILMKVNLKTVFFTDKAHTLFHREINIPANGIKTTNTATEFILQPKVTYMKDNGTTE